MDHHHHHQHQHNHHREPPHHHREPPHHHSHPMYPTNSSLYMISTPNYTPHNPSGGGNRFPFNSSPPPHTVATPPSKLPSHGLEPMTSPYSASASVGDGGGGGGYGFDPNSQKKKRGRPRKYFPDNGGGGRKGGGGGGIALGLSPTPLSSGGGGGGDSTGVTPSSENSSKKNRGRPSGSSKKQLDALGNCGVGFTPHVILVNAGEDIASKILAFSKQGARTVCVLSANGSICNVDLRQPAMSGGVVKYEGRFEIISLSGSYLFSESTGGQVRSGLSVSLAGTDGRVLGGGVVGALRAATPVQIIVGSFIADGKKSKSMPAVTQSRTFSFSAPQSHPPTNSSPISQEASSEGSEENDNDNNNHIGRNMSSYGNSSHPADHNMQIYSHMNWPNPSSKMLQN